jgi:hypothetical protein
LCTFQWQANILIILQVDGKIQIVPLRQAKSAKYKKLQNVNLSEKSTEGFSAG